MSRPEPLRELLKGVSLPSLPHVLLEIYDLLHSEVAGVDEMVVLLENDTGLTARTLRLANSAYYGRAGQVTRVREALLRIGPFDLWWLLFTTEVKNLFFGIDRRLMDMEQFWRHSLLVACGARALSRRQVIGSPGDLFVAGLLHDVGKLLLLQRLPIEYGEVLRLAAEQGGLVTLENQLLGFSHAEAGGVLLAHWDMPDLFVQTASRHHDESPEDAESRLVQLADRLAHQLMEGDESTEMLDPALIESVVSDYEKMVERVL